MDRREFLRGTGVAAAAASATVAVSGESAEAASVAPPSIAIGPRRLTLSMPWADDGKGFADSVTRLSRRIELLSGGEWRIERVASDAEADLRHGTAHDQLALHPAFAYFAGLPGGDGLSPLDLDAWLTIGGAQQFWDALAAEHGLKPLLAGHSGTAPPLWTRTPVTGLEDLAGARIFVMGLAADVARALGAEPVTMPAPALTGALADGGVSFVEWGGALQSLALGLHEQTTYAVGHGLNGQGTALCLSVRLPVWEQLSEGEKALLRAATAEEYRVSVAEQRVHETMIRKAIAGAPGVQFVPFPDDVADAIARVADATIAHTSGYDADAARINRSYMSFRSAIEEALPLTA